MGTIVEIGLVNSPPYKYSSPNSPPCKYFSANLLNQGDVFIHFYVKGSISCFPVLFELMMALQSRETHSITLKNLALFSPKLFVIPNAPIRLQDLAKNNAVEFSIRMIQLTRF